MNLSKKLCNKSKSYITEFILFAARQEQIQSAIEQDKLYEDHVRQAVDLMLPGTTSRSLSNISVQANPIVVSASTNCCIGTTGPSPQSDPDLLQNHRSNQAYCIIVWKLKPICDRKFYNVFEIWWNDNAVYSSKKFT